MTESGQDRKRRIKFKCKCTRYGIFVEIGRNASDIHICRTIVANMNCRRKPGETKRLTTREYYLRDPLAIANLSFCFLTILIFAAFMILPRWIPRGNPEGVYDVRIWLANCLCGDGRAFLVVTDHRACQTVWFHPGDGFISTEGTWKNGVDDHSFVFELKDADGEILPCRAECYWGGMKWWYELDGVQSDFFWFPRLISEVYCDYYNKYFWLIGVFIAICIMYAANILFAAIASISADRLLKQRIKNKQKQ